MAPTPYDGAIDARFCYKCGKPVEITSESEEMSSADDKSKENSEQEQQSANVNDSKTGYSFLGYMFEKVSTFASDKFPSSENLSRKLMRNIKMFSNQ